MNKKILIGCIGAATIIIIAAFTSVVGVQSTELLVKKSPLFEMRIKNAINTKCKIVKTVDYIGKANEHPYFFNYYHGMPEWLDKIVEQIKKNPDIVDKSLLLIHTKPEIMNALDEIGMSKSDLKFRTDIIKKAPSKLKEEIIKAVKINPEIKNFLDNIKLSKQDQPDTSSGDGCLISAVITALLLPAIVLSILFLIFILTMTIITCFVENIVADLFEIMMNPENLCLIS